MPIEIIFEMIVDCFMIKTVQYRLQTGILFVSRGTRSGSVASGYALQAGKGFGK